MATREPHIRPSDQILIVGMNGSGKSVLAEYLFGQIHSTRVVINVKREPKITRFCRQIAMARPEDQQYEHEPVIGKPGKLDFKLPVVEYIPVDPYSVDECDELYRELAKRRNMTVWLDECYGMTTSNRLPRGLGVYLQHGRASNLRHLGCTQRPVHIAKPLLTEASHIVLFPNGLNADDLAFVGKQMSLSPQQTVELVASVQDERYGPYVHLWYEKRARRIHRRPSLRI